MEPFVASKIPELSKENDLATTGKSLALAIESDDVTKSVLGYIKVFSRMTPDAKETVIECLHSVDSTCLMCGDGANDVGALKMSHCNISIISVTRRLLVVYLPLSSLSWLLTLSYAIF